MLQLKRVFHLVFLLLLHGEDQHSAHRQRQQTDEILRNGELPELGDLVVTGAHDHGGQRLRWGPDPD